MADKSPKKSSAKKPGASLKEKRMAKKMKQAGDSGLGVTNRGPKTTG
jgi:hypothetical protein